MQVDYLIVGAGATGLAFLDTLLAETDATVAIVDRRDEPGGHWVDAYSFVRLHQSSSFYGVASRDMGQLRVSQTGYNAGLHELASRAEILHYYKDLMENTYLPSGRVHYFPMSEHVGDGLIRSLLTGHETQVDIGRKLVNAGIWGDLGSIPSTHERPFEVDDGATCIAINDLPRRAPEFERFTVLGAGKTAMDAILWLLSRGIKADQVSWVRPNDYWIFCRDNIMAHPDYFDASIGGLIAETRSLATSETVDAHCRKMEEVERWMRIDTDVWPARFHAAVCSRAEIEALREVREVIRLGHVQRIEPGRMVLADGEVKVEPETLFVDCTARAGVSLGKDHPPVFDGNTINTFMLRPFQPLFSAALIAYLEAHFDDPDLLARCTQVTNFHDTPAEFVAVQAVAYMNQGAWNQIEPLRAWMDTCRLSAPKHLLDGIGPEDTEKLAMLKQIGPLTMAALENIPKMLAASR